jgi:maltose O-acetyltransferase
LLDSQQRVIIGNRYKQKNDERDRWQKEFLINQKFLLKWSGMKYSMSGSLREKRDKAYKKHYGYGNLVKISSDVVMKKHHYQNGKMIFGKECKMLEDVDIDYTGGLTVKNNVSISEGAKILTHNHVIDFSGKDDSKGCILTPLLIHDRVWIGARAVIMPGVREIGRGALVSAGAYISKKIPPYAIVAGNPAKIVGFRMPLEEIIEYEKSHYEEKDRIPSEILIKNYEKYFQSRWKDIKEYNRL